MKTLWQKARSSYNQFINDESGQGATEYILLLVVVVAVSFLFKDKLLQIVGDKLGEIGGSIGGFTSQ